MWTRARRILRIFSAMIMVSCLYGCAGPVGQSPAPDMGNSTGIEEPVEIEIAQWSVPSELFEEALKRFNAGSPIHVNVLSIPSDRYIETINMLNAAGTGPDVYEILREWLKSHALQGWAADLSDSVDGDFLKRFPQWAQDYVNDPSYNGALYSLPSNLVTYRLIYNKDLFRHAGLDPDAPPKTLRQLAEYAKAISNRELGERKYGFALPMGEDWLGFVQAMEAANCYSGVYFFDFRRGQYDLPVYRPWFDAIAGMKSSGGLFPGMETMKQDLAVLQFSKGNVGMMYASSWQVSALFNQSKPAFDWGVAEPPAMDGAGAGKGAIGMGAVGWHVVNAHTGHFEQAVEVWKSLYSDEYLAGLMERQSALPIVDNLMDRSDKTRFDPRYLPFLPGPLDSVYPNTPLNLDEWARKDVYASILKGLAADTALSDESIRLNALLNNQTLLIRGTNSDFVKPDFDPRNPMK